MARYSMHPEPGRIVVTVPAVFSWYFFLFAPAFVAMLIYSLREGSGFWSLLMRAWFAVLGAALLFGWIFMLKGKEELNFTPDRLIHRTILFGIARTRDYEAARIWSPFFELYHGHRGAVHTAMSFYYDGKLVRMCNAIQQSDAKEIVEAVLRQIPELASTWGRYSEGVPVTKGSVVLNLK